MNRDARPLKISGLNCGRAHAKHLAGLRKSLKVMESRRLGSIQDANMAARSLAESLDQVLDTTRQMGKLAHEISGGPVPVYLTIPDTVSRLCGRLSAVMGTVSGYRNRFGRIEWKNASLYRSSDNWRDCEAKILEGHLSPDCPDELQQARLELQAIRGSAYQITFPDGSIRSVYPDGDKVRTEDGAEVDASIIDPGDIPDIMPTWDDLKSSRDHLNDRHKYNISADNFDSLLGVFNQWRIE